MLDVESALSDLVHFMLAHYYCRNKSVVDNMSQTCRAADVWAYCMHSSAKLVRDIFCAIAQETAF